MLATKTVRLVIVLFALSVVVFFSQTLLPGDPAELIGAGAGPERIDEIREDLKLDEPIYVQYGSWLGDFVTGDLGDYYRAKGGTPAEGVRNNLPNTLLLILYTQILALVIAIPMGVFAAYRSDKLFDRSANVVSFLGLSIPAFVLAFMFKKYFALDNRWLPERGWVSPTDDFPEHLRYAILPVLTLAVAQIAVYFRLLRSDMIATLQEDYITMAKAKGLKPNRILFRHALRPSSLTLLTVAGLNIGTMISSGVVIEVIFEIPGMGTLLVEGILAREYRATQSFVVIVGIFFVLLNYFIDFLYTVIDPRIRHG